MTCRLHLSAAGAPVSHRKAGAGSCRDQNLKSWRVSVSLLRSNFERTGRNGSAASKARHSFREGREAIVQNTKIMQNQPALLLLEGLQTIVAT